METGISRKQIERCFTRARCSYDHAATAQQAICRRASALLAPFLSGEIRTALEVGCGTGGFTRHLQRLLPAARWTLNDLSEPCAREASRYAPRATLAVGDAERMEWAGRFNLVASASTVQWFAEPWAWVERIAHCQQSGDLLCLTTFLPGNLGEIRQLTGKGLDYPPSESWRRWLSPFYDLKILEGETLRLAYPSPLDVLKHLKQTGVTATGSEFWTRSRLADFSDRYQSHFTLEGGWVGLTYLPLYILAIKKESWEK